MVTKHSCRLANNVAPHSKLLRNVLSTIGLRYNTDCHRMLNSVYSTESDKILTKEIYRINTGAYDKFDIAVCEIRPTCI